MSLEIAQESSIARWRKIEAGLRLELERFDWGDQWGRILLALLRGSIGRGQREVRTKKGLNWFVERTGILYPHVSKAVRGLMEANVLAVDRDRDGDLTRYRLLLDSDKWNVTARNSRKRLLTAYYSAEQEVELKFDLPPGDLPGALVEVMEAMAMDRAEHDGSVVAAGVSKIASDKRGTGSIETVGGRGAAGDRQPHGDAGGKNGVTESVTPAKAGGGRVTDSVITESVTAGAKSAKNGLFLPVTDSVTPTSKSKWLTGLNSPVQGQSTSELVNGGGARVVTQRMLAEEKEFLGELAPVFGPEVMGQWAKYWRICFRDCPGAAWAALRDLQSRIKEGLPPRYPGPWMRDLFLRFKKGHRSFVPRDEL